jgi:phosphoribosyl 1,2-cyclic phosphodiesterase
MRVRFRGVRGSVPWAVPGAAGYGCNTACLEIADERSGAALVLDGGSGIVGADPPARDVSLLLTHYHWDHILGLPFFGPLFHPDRTVSLHVPNLPARDAAWLDMLFREPFFPVPCEDLPRPPPQHLVEPGPVAIDGFEVRALALNHPGGALAYRITGRDGDIVYATDHEFGDPAYDEPLAAFVSGAAAAVLDAHFTPDERARHRGWGHSDWRECAEFAARHGVGALYLFHHKPGRTDAELDAIERDARGVFAATHVAREGHTLTV